MEPSKNIQKLKIADRNTQNKEQLHSSKSGIPTSGLISENKPYIHLQQLISFNTSGSQPGLAHSPLFKVPLSSLPPIFHSTVFFPSPYIHSFSIQFLLSSSHTQQEKVLYIHAQSNIKFFLFQLINYFFFNWRLITLLYCSVSCHTLT